MTYIPKVLTELKEIKAIFESEDIEIQLLESKIKDAFDDQFIQTSTENGVLRWENILKIKSKVTDNLEDRKFRILTRINEQIPFTMITLKQQLESLCGMGGYTVDLKKYECELLVKVALTAKNNFQDVGNMLERVVPENLIINLILMYNQHITLQKCTHAQLAVYTHWQLRNEVIV